MSQKRLTQKQATEAARWFVRTYIKADRQWNEKTLSGALDYGWEIPIGVLFDDSPTIANIAQFFRYEARCWFDVDYPHP